jgi:hypothetical protein
MDWTQLISLGGYLTAVCGFFYYLSEKTVKEWRDEHKSQTEKNESHWREMFRYMSDRLDRSVEKK